MCVPERVTCAAPLLPHICEMTERKLPAVTVARDRSSCRISRAAAPPFEFASNKEMPCSITTSVGTRSDVRRVPDFHVCKTAERAQTFRAKVM